MKLQKQTVMDFINDMDGSKASNLKTVELNNGNTAIVGYDRAVYAERNGDEVIIYLGWDDFSKTTANHLRMIRNAVEADSYLYMTGKDRKKHYSGGEN